MVRDRISRVRHERTMTMKEPRSESRGFEHILTEEEKEGLSPEEKMKLIAAKMERKFKVEERRVSTTVGISCYKYEHWTLWVTFRGGGGETITRRH